MADGTFTHGTKGTGAGGIAAKAKAKAKEAEDLTEANRIARAAVYGGDRAFAELSPARRRDLLTDAWILMHAPAEQKAEREKRQRAAGVEPEKIPLERTLKNQWRNEREKTARQRKILAFGYAITAAAVAGEAAEIADAARSRPLPVLAEFRAPVFAKRERNIGEAV